MKLANTLGWLKKHWIKLTIFIFLVFPLVSFLLTSTAILAFTFWPSSYSKMTSPSIDKQASHIVLIAHGLGDTTASWSDSLKQIMQSLIRESGSDEITQVISLDWNPYSETTFKCSVNGRRIGGLIAEKIATSDNLQSLHLIGHSCGSFVIYGFCETMRELRSEVSIQSTYLDPVSIYGGLFWNYGVENFGACADYAEAYIDSEDGVPGSNGLLPNTHTFDITQARKLTDFSLSPHVWPTHYYQRLAKTGLFPDLKRNRDIATENPKGRLTTVKELPQQ